MLNEWSDYREYVFVLKDGSERYEMCKSNSDVHSFMKMHDAVKGIPLSHHESQKN